MNRVLITINYFRTVGSLRNRLEKTVRSADTIRGENAVVIPSAHRYVPSHRHSKQKGEESSHGLGLKTRVRTAGRNVEFEWLMDKLL